MRLLPRTGAVQARRPPLVASPQFSFARAPSESLFRLAAARPPKGCRPRAWQGRAHKGFWIPRRSRGGAPKKVAEATYLFSVFCETLDDRKFSAGFEKKDRLRTGNVRFPGDPGPIVEQR
jgi:hypothetical protein